MDRRGWSVAGSVAERVLTPDASGASHAHSKSGAEKPKRLHSVCIMLSDSDNNLLYESSALKIIDVSGGIRTCAVHPVNRERKQFGEYHHLFPQLKQSPDSFF